MKKLFILLYFFLLIPLSQSFGQVISTEGKEFYVGFMQINPSGTNSLRFIISSRLGATGTISMPTNAGFTSVNFTVTPNSTFPLNTIAASLAASGSGTVENKGFYIKSNDNDISVTAINFSTNRTEASAVLPITSLGSTTEYLINTNQGSQSQILIVGVVDGTSVDITQPSGTPINVILNRGQTVQYQSFTNWSGTRIKSAGGTCKPFAVFAGSNSVTVDCPIGGTGSGSSQHTFEQQYPIQTWGTQYIVTPYSGLEGYFYRVVAKENATTVNINDGINPINVVSLNSGETFLGASPTNSTTYCVNSDKPISISQVTPNSNCSGQGDASLLVLNPLNQTTTQTTFNTITLGGTGFHFVNVIMKTIDIGTLKFNNSSNMPSGATVASFFNAVPSCVGYSFAQLLIANNNTLTTTNLSSTKEFVAFAYGYSSVDVYAYSVGASFENQQYNFTATPNPSCFDGSVASRTINFIGTGINVTSYSYDFGDATPVVNAQNATHVYATSGTYTVTMTVAVIGGCGTDAVTKTVQIYDGVTPPNIGTNKIICQNAVFTLTAPTGIDQTYQWFKDNVAITLNGTSQTYTVPTTTPSVANYKVTIRKGTGVCDVTSNSVQITVVEPPVATLSPATGGFCGGGSVTLTATLNPLWTYEFFKNMIPIVGAGGLGINTTVINTVGNYTCKVTNEFGCPMTTNTSVISGPPTILPVITGADARDYFCEGGSLLLSSTVTPTDTYTYQWQQEIATVYTDIAGATNATYAATAAGNYKLVATSTINTCQGTSLVFAVLQKSNPITTIIATPNTNIYCEGETINLTTTSAPMGEPYTYEWSRNNVVFSTLQNPIFTAITGTYNYKVKIINTITLCEATSPDFAITVNPKPFSGVVATPFSGTACQGNTVTLTTATPQIGQTYTYQWFNNNVLMPGETNSELINTVSGNYTVEITNNFNCKVTSLNTTVTIFPIPDATITSTLASPFCSDVTTTLSTVPVTAGQAWTYKWKRNNGDIAGETNATLVTNLSGSYTVEITNNFNCVVTTAVPIVLIVNPAPNPALTTTTPLVLCQGENVVISTETVPVGSTWTYKWFRNNVAITPAATNPTYTATTSGDYTVEITTDKNCLKTTAIPVSVTVNVIPDATITSTLASPFCSDLTTTISTVAVPMGQTWTYQWKRNNVDIVGETNPTLVTNLSGSYTVEITNAFNCVVTTAIPFVLVVNPSPNPALTTTTPLVLCQGQNVLISTETVPVGSTWTYKWFKNGVAIIPAATSATYVATTSGDYTVEIKTDKNCLKTTAIPVSVIVNPLPVVAISGIAVGYCSNDPLVDLTGKGSPTGGVFTLSKNGGAFNVVTSIDIPTISFGTYVLRYDYINPTTNCTNFATFNFNINNVVAVNITNLNAKYCINDAPVVLTGSGVGGTASFTINGNVATVFDPTLLGVIGLTHTVVYKYTYGTGCFETDTKIVTVNQLPVVAITNLNAQYCSNGVTVPLTASTTPVGGTGIFRINGTVATTFNPVTLGTGNHLVTYNYTDLNGCENLATKNVQVLAPTALTFNALASKYCENVADITLSANPAGGKFYVNNVLETKFRPTTLGVGVHAVKYEFTQAGAAACTDFIIQAVTVVAPTKIFYAAPIRTDYCVVDADFLLKPTPVGAMVTIDGVPALVSPTDPNAYIFSPSTLGSRATAYVVETTFIDANLCKDVLISNVFVNPLPIVTMSGVNAAYCENDNAFTPIVNPAGGTFTVNGVATSAPINPKTLGAGTYTLVYTYKDAKTCQQTATTSFIVKPLPTPVITTVLKAVYCTTEGAVFLNATPLGGAFFINGIPATGLPNTGINTVSFNPATVGVSPNVEIVYTYTAANGCTNTTKTTTQIIAPPAIPTLTNVVSCKSAGNVRLNAFVASHDTNISYVWTNKATAEVLATTASLIVTTSGTYRVQITDARACNPVFAEAKVDINPNPKVDLGANRNICGNNVITLDADPTGLNTGTYKYLWNTGATTQTIQVKSDTIRGARSYWVKVTDENFTSKCSSADTILLFFNDIPVVNLGKDRAICNPSDVPYTLVGLDISHSNMGVTYKWTDPFAANPATALATTANYNITAPGVYALTVTTNKGCSKTDTVQILFDSDPSLKILGANEYAGVCQVRDTLYVQATNILDYNVTWSGAGIVSTSADKLSIIVNKSGRYFVSAIDKTKTTKCDAVLFVDVFIADFPAVKIKPISTTRQILACQDSTVTLNAGDTSHRATFKYEWKIVGKDAVIATTAQYAVTQAMVGNFDPIRYAVKVSPPSGCVSFDTVTVQFQPKPIAKIDENYPKQICFGESFTLRASGGTEFKWTSTDKDATAIPSNPTVVFKPKAAGTYTYTVEVSTPTSTICKSNKVSVTVIVNPPMIAKIPNKDVKLCEDSSIELDGFDPLHPLSVRYAWKSLATGANIGTSSKQKFDFATLLPRPSYNTEQYEFSVTDGITGCVAKDTMKITFLRKAKPIIDRKAPTQICLGDTIKLVATQGGTYRWSTGSRSDTTVTIPKTVGSYTYWVAAKFDNACTEGTDTIRVRVNPLPVAVANADKNLKICAGNSVTLEASGGVRYEWRHGDKTAKTTVSPKTDTRYYVTVFNESGCKSTDEVLIRVTPIKELPPRIVLCENERTTLDATNPAATATEPAKYLWNTGDQRPIIPIFKAGTYTVMVTIANCTYTQTTEVIYRSRPRISLANDTLLCFARANEIAAPPYRAAIHTLQAKLTNREAGETYYYDWRIKGSSASDYILGAVGTVGADNIAPLPLTIVGADTSYIVRIRVASTNCETYDTIRVNMNCDARIKIPSAFTPNDDKLNDTFAPITSDLTGILIQVYHKWGDVVFEVFIDPKKNKNKEIWDGVFDEKLGWDGTFGGSPVAVDSYQYVIVYWSKDKKGFAVRQSTTGSVQVIREFAK